MLSASVPCGAGSSVGDADDRNREPVDRERNQFGKRRCAAVIDDDHLEIDARIVEPRKSLKAASQKGRAFERRDDDRETITHGAWSHLGTTLFGEQFCYRHRQTIAIISRLTITSESPWPATNAGRLISSDGSDDKVKIA